MIDAKKQSEQHIVDRQGQALLERKLPRHWLLRPYRPDYGLDFSLEVFKEAATKRGGGVKTYETLGEHIFIQLKTVVKAEPKPLAIYGRGNVEKAREKLDTNNLVTTLETCRQVIETPELVTIERMGIAVPVLLVVADLASENCYFVCLNDYIDKIFIPRHDDYRASSHRTVHVPTINEISLQHGIVALRWYLSLRKSVHDYRQRLGKSER